MSEFRVRYPYGGKRLSLFTPHGQEWSKGNRRVLQVDLPCHSVHEARFVREPMRLNVVMEAPIRAMNAILEKHPSARARVDNGWLHLYALGAAGHVIHRYAGGLTWEPAAPMNAELAA